ncbi:MAG: rplY [Candidatus Saccharibacteria bacterium]|nr:rplY [Candidatus Saccharibacteria bacterium]
MSSVDEPVVLEERTVMGKGLNSLRSEGFVPAVIHNHGQESVHVMASQKELTKIYREAGKHHPLELHIGSQRYLALIKDAHFNPVKQTLLHVVFQAIRRDEKVEAEVPVHLVGDAPAEKVGLMLLHQLDVVQIEALPKNLPDELTVDASKLVELHDKLTVADIKAPEGVTILTEMDYPIASVVETKAQMSEEAAEEPAEGAEAEAAEGEQATGEKEA